MLCNLGRAREVMEREGLDALVATTPEHVLYLSDFETRLPFQTGTGAAAVIPRDPDRPAILVIAVAYLGHVASEPTWMEEIRCYGGLGVVIHHRDDLPEPEATTLALFDQHRPNAFPSQAAALADALGAAGALGGTVGTDGRPPTDAALDGTTWRDARSAFEEIRLIKTDEEVARLREAARVNESAFDRAEAAIAVGGRWSDAITAWRMRWAELGGTAAFWGSGPGPLAAQLFPERAEHILDAGDLIRWEGGGTYRGYWADTGRSAVVGSATAEQLTAHAGLEAGSELARATLGPGVRGDDICPDVVRAIRANGLPDFPDGNVWGHGVGLDLNERPRVRRGVDDPLQPGMVIAFETPYFSLGWGALQVEDTFLITEDGAELLTAAPRRLVELPEVGA